MEIADLIRHYPLLYHTTEPALWPRVLDEGLFSASALLDRFEMDGPARAAIESDIRPESVTIEHPHHGSAVIHHQKPLVRRHLERCLDGLSVREWCELINRHVFFCPTLGRLQTLQTTRHNRGRDRLVLVFATEALVERHATHIRLTPINTGAALYPNAAVRGRHTFATIADYPFAERRRTRSVAQSLAEVAVPGHLPRIGDLLLRAELWHGGDPVSVVWQR